MIPILFNASDTSFNTNGIGALSDSKSCKVTEKRNAEYELKLTYPVKGKFADQIQNEAIVVAVPSKGTEKQAFRIYSVSDNLNGTMDVLANHVSYDANYIPIKPFNAEGLTAALAGFHEYNLETNPFTITAPGFDNETTVYQQVEPRSLRACLGGSEGSILDTFSSHGHGEYEWDNYNIRFHYNRGSDKGYTIRYAKNLSEYDRERDSSETFTGVVAYYKSSGDEGSPETVYYSQVQYSDLKEEYPVNKTVVVNATDSFESIPTLSQLNAWALAYANEMSKISESIDISFVDIDDQDINLCDTVSVKYSYVYKGKTVKVVDFKSKVVKTVWDVLLDRYESITLGENKSDLGSTLSDTINDTATQVANQAVESSMVSVVSYIDREVGKAVNDFSKITEGITTNLLGAISMYIQNDGEKPQIDDENWSVLLPEEVEGKTIWYLTQFDFNDGTYTRTDPIRLESGITAVEDQYYLSTSNETQEGGSWSNVMPTPAAGWYLWSRIKLTHTDESITYTDPVLSYMDLQKTVVLQGTSIAQNTEDIQLRATKTEVEEGLTSANTRITQASSDIQMLSDQISSTVTEITRVENSIPGIAQNEAEALIDASETRTQTQINQTASEINATISQVQTNVQNNEEQISEMYTYFTFASDGLTVGKSTSDIRGKFGNSALEFIDKQGNKIAWVDGDNSVLGGNELSVGEYNTQANRWRIFTRESGAHLTFTRHT